MTRKKIDSQQNCRKEKDKESEKHETIKNREWRVRKKETKW